MKKYRLLFMIVLMMILPLSVSAQHDATMKNDEESDELQIKVGTYNIQAGMDNDGEYNLNSTAEVIRESGADIIGLNEVDVHWGERSDFANTVKELADELDMEYFFAPIYDMDPLNPGEPNRQYGVAVLSKYPIIHAENREITRLSTQDPDPSPKPTPGFLQAQIHVGGEEVWFYATHLSLELDIREIEVHEMIDIISEHDHSILTGDMNANPDAPDLEPLFSTFQDAWEATNDGPGYTFPADDPIKRIDDIFLTPGVQIDSAEVIDTLASDHLPVTADLTLKPGEHPFTASGMKKLVAYLRDHDEIMDNKTEHAMKMHLSAISHYEQIEEAEKVIKHTESFKTLLEYQRDKDMISEDAYNMLEMDADHLIREWE
ncbi:MAG TPA: endonuclease/exonuclease/phosphatase family protein [Virgibacillus sp.]|nr:endonuclease/exonuclease/phosphatase family protein [Virgibacillus sp.]